MLDTFSSLSLNKVDWKNPAKIVLTKIDPITFVYKRVQFVPPIGQPKCVARILCMK